jgi:hypothetical protein
VVYKTVFSFTHLLSTYMSSIHKTDIEAATNILVHIFSMCFFLEGVMVFIQAWNCGSESTYMFSFLMMVLDSFYAWRLSMKHFE